MRKIQNVKVTLSAPLAAGAIDDSRLIIGKQCNATEINADEVSGLRLIEQTYAQVCRTLRISF